MAHVDRAIAWPTPSASCRWMRSSAPGGPSGRAARLRRNRHRAVHAPPEVQSGRIRSGSTATASSCRTATARCCSMRCCIWRGYAGFPLDEIRRFRELGSHTHGHPECEPDRGIEVTTGPLGQGIANAVGMAVAEAFLNAILGADIVDHHTYALVGDGCLQEGLGQEVISLAGHLRLGKLVFLWDDNRMTDDGPIDLALSDDMPARFRLSNWQVQEVDGHDADAVSAAILLAKQDPRPSMIACRTIIGRGLPKIEGTRAAHSATARQGADRRGARGIWTGRTRRSRCPTTCSARGGEPGGAACRTTRRGRLASPHCRRRSGASSTGCARGACPQAGSDALDAFKRRCLAERKAEYGIKLSADIIDMLAETIPELLSRRAGSRGRHPAQAPARGVQRRRSRRALRPLRHPRARDGRDAERHGGAWRRAAATGAPIWCFPTTCARRCGWRR